MKITEKQVRRIADLANLNLSDVDISRYAADMEQILGYVDKLNELDTSDVEPMAQVLADQALADQSLGGAAENSTLREDVLGGSFERERALRSAPMSGAGHFKVPKVIER